MFNLYSKNLVSRIAAFVLALILSNTVIAQCPAGSVSPTNYASYGSGVVVCISGNSNLTITLNSGAELVISPTGSFTGTVNANPGSVITVQAGGNFVPASMNNFKGKLVNAGTTVLTGGSIGIAENAIFENTGTMSFNAGIGFWGNNTQIKNLEYGTMYWNLATFQLPTGGVLSNDGVLYTKNLTIQTNTSFLNRGKAYITGNLSLSGKLVNDYLVVIKGTTSKQGSDSLINYNMMVFDGTADFNGGVRNEGLFWSTSGKTTFHNGTLTQNNPAALTVIQGSGFYNNATIQGTGGFYSAFTPVRSDGKFQGFNSGSTLMTNFTASEIDNNQWSPSSNSNLNGVLSASFPLYDTLNYIATWANPAAPFAQSSMLPIVLGDLKAVVQGSAILINWNTLIEINGQYMVLQHSTNGTVFSDLYKVNSNGSIYASAYQYKHTQPASGMNYYRIKMVSGDEAVKYSSVVTGKIGATAASVKMSVYPNPFNSQLQVKYSAGSKGAVTVRLISTEGKTVMNKVLNADYAGVQNVSINTPSELKPGIYFLEVNTNEGSFRSKLVKN